MQSDYEKVRHAIGYWWRDIHEIRLNFWGKWSPFKDEPLPTSAYKELRAMVLKGEIERVRVGKYKNHFYMYRRKRVGHPLPKMIRGRRVYVLAPGE